MASVSRLPFSLLVLLLTVNDVYSAVDAGRSSSGTGPAYQTCPTGYYCPFDKLCHYPRSNRCTGNQNCSYLDECYQQSDGSYLIRIGHAKLFGSKRTLFEHRFVIYRGFAYEFGGSYNTQILDASDPDYKYVNGRYLNSNGITNGGTSYCSFSDASQFTDSWTRKYNVFTNNCQHFVKALVVFLTSSCNGQSKREIDISSEIENIMTNCSIVCCNPSSSATVIVPTLTTLIFLMSFVTVIV